MNRKPNFRGIPQLSEEGQQYVKEHFAAVTIPIAWQYRAIFDAIEGRILETPETYSMHYEIPAYYTQKKIPHVIHFNLNHFIWE